MPTVDIEADYNVQAVFVGFALRDATGSMSCGVNNGPVVLRLAFRFDMSAIPAGSTVSAASVQSQQPQSNDPGAQTWRYGPFDGDGLADPEAVNDDDLYAGCDLSGTAYTTTTAHRTDGNKSVDLTSAAFSDIEAAIALGATYTVSIQQIDEATEGHAFTLFGIDQVGEAEIIPTLTVEYTEGEDPPPEEPAGSPSSADGQRWAWR